MCGRFTFILPWSEIVRLYRLTLDKDIFRNLGEPRYNIAPTQNVLFVHHGENGEQILDEGRWSLVPHWAKETPKIATFNARIETADTAPAFRDSFKAKRCLVAADGFYEWTPSDDGKKDPWHIFLPDHQPFSFAGLWAYNGLLDLRSCTIITGPAEGAVTQLHGRMPIILAPEVYDEWLDPKTTKDRARELLKHNLNRQLQFHRVNRDVNSSRFAGKPEPLNPL
ncbi:MULTISPECIES: SOS response-associated peptidase [unclassified Rhizobium]|uniref:SOS response-associated peptidase n=1 Tax=unclassified Rhizobium TaxID=2613769 RepID=UPI0007006D21|nr:MULTISPECIES: SOS response-associated peptidase [unclassified Rhizobium]KQV39906.1 hypothetical protein ASC86_21910 [Rhizobium sp. Root1212]KRD31616.1 hypothetical protein ASE37_22955 [Rhizobium sp. Root268]